MGASHPRHKMWEHYENTILKSDSPEHSLSPNTTCHIHPHLSLFVSNILASLKTTGITFEFPNLANLS